MPETIYRPIKDLKKLPNNPRLIKDKDFARLCKSVKDNPDYFEARPVILSDRTGELVIIAGNQRYEAAKHLKLKEVPTCLLSGLTEDREREIVIRDNVSNGEFDWDLLSSSWDDCPLTEWGLDLPEDWKPVEAQKNEDESAVAEMVDRAAELQEKWKVKRGDIFQIGRHRLMCGDSTRRADVARLMGGESASAVLTDPIYGQGQEGVTNDQPEGFEDTIRGAVAALPVDNAAIVAFASPRTFPVWLDAIRDAGHKFERMLWMYKAAQCTFPWRGWILKSESILVSTKGEAAWQDVHPYSHDCYYLAEVSGELDESIGWHGSVKPLKVVADLLVRISAQGDAVFDGFSGSGTTMAACEENNRRAMCIDIDPLNCAVTLERMSGLGLKPELLK